MAANSTTTEKARRFLSSHVPNGAAQTVAEQLDAKPSRLSREMEGRALLSVDGFVGFASSLAYEDRLRLFTYLLEPFGFAPLPVKVRDLDDSSPALAEAR